MPAAVVSVDIDAPPAEVFDLVHDYERRLAWDPFLSAAFLLENAERAGCGVKSRCIARASLGGWAMDTVYVSFRRPRVAAVRMVSGPWLFHQFAASLRHEPLPAGGSRVTYRYRFACRPKWLRFLLEPIVQWVLRRETAGRLAALRRYVGRGT